MLIDKYLPAYDVTVVRQALVEADREETWASIKSADLARISPAVTALGWLRMLPERVSRFARRAPPLPKTARVTLDDIVASGWTLLEEQPPDEIVFGAVGQFWRPVIRMQRVSASEFLVLDRPDTAKLAVSFRVEARGEDQCLLRYEARTASTSESARKRFRRYWSVIGPFAGFIMERAVDAIKAEAEDLHRERAAASARVRHPAPPSPPEARRPSP